MPRSLFFILFFSIQTALAQKEASIWYFGNNAGLDFNTGSPRILTDGQLSTDEGVASICDAQGKLLFYTDGIKIFNSRHQVMQNGNGLLGNISSSQSSIIVPKINDPLRYYVFTIAQLGEPDGFNYSIVNMSLDGGLGEVETKNIRLQNNVCEKLTAVKHCNGKDIWVIVHGFNSATFHAYLVTAAGVNTVPVVTTAGRLVPNSRGDYAIGCMKVSPDGTKIAIAHKLLGVDLLDFDNSSGVVSNGNSLFLATETYASYRGAYGVEFSPNSKYVYVSGDHFDFTLLSEMSYLLQYDVSLPVHGSVQASKKVVYQQPSHWSTENFGTLQLAPDGKIYMAEFGQTFISVINSPNADGVACQFVHAAVDTWQRQTGGGWCRYGLPAFIQSFFSNSFSIQGACHGTVLQFDYQRSTADISIKWDFDDPLSGVNNTSIQESTQHQFSADGLYNVKLIRFTACGSDTIIQPVSAGASQLTLGNDTVLCGVAEHRLMPAVQGNNSLFLWNDGSTANTLNAITTGLYWVEITNALNSCSTRDSIYLTLKPNPVVNLGSDQAKCEGDVVDLEIKGLVSCVWSNGSTLPTLRVSQPGIVWVDVTTDGCTVRDSIQFFYHGYPQVLLGNDTSLCENSTLLLDAHNPGTSFKWQDHTVNQTFLVETPGLYWVAANNHGCMGRDTIKVNYVQPPRFTLGADTRICRDSKLILRARIETGTHLDYIWNTGSRDDSIEISQAGTYSLSLSNQCGYSSDAIIVKEEICDLYVPSAFSPNRDGINETFHAVFGGDMNQFELVVYNRWGQIIFRSNDINTCWDGNFQGKPQPTGIYLWVIRYITKYEPNEKIIKGTTTLVR